MRSVDFKNLIEVEKRDLIVSDLIPQNLEFESEKDLFLKIKDHHSGRSVISKFRKLNSELLFSSVKLEIKRDYFLTAELKNIKTGNTYTLDVYDDSLRQMGKLKMNCENSNWTVEGNYLEEDGYLKVRLFLFS